MIVDLFLDEQKKKNIMKTSKIQFTRFCTKYNKSITSNETRNMVFMKDENSLVLRHRWVSKIMPRFPGKCKRRCISRKSPE